MFENYVIKSPKNSSIKNQKKLVNLVGLQARTQGGGGLSPPRPEIFLKY